MERSPTVPEATFIEQLGRDISAALQGHDGAVDCVYLFGSMARGNAGPLSDADLAILFKEELAAEARTGIAASIASQAQTVDGPAIDIAILNDAPPLLQHRVIREGRPVFVGNEASRVAFETRAIREYLDFQPVLDRYDRALLAPARGGRFGA